MPFWMVQNLIILIGVGSYKYDGFINRFANRKFKETLGEYNYDVDIKTNDEIRSVDSSLLKNKKKRVIIYQLQN